MIVWLRMTILCTISKACDKGRGGHVTGGMVLPVTAASLGAALVLVIAVFTVTTIKLQKDKANMAKLIIMASPG